MIVIIGTGVYAIRKCIYVDTHEVEYTIGFRFDQVNATLETVCGTPGRCNGRGKVSAFGYGFDIVNGGGGGVCRI